ncbi:NAD(P)/FAD-dependent oxidoreductase [Croceicoccus hydrothermalis]|uniref:NAD(P)/FAD-dependent oxidoreductase n=1 Tax=Croceicoccus hydrothermalis TaxID=2867964 RepID=UPI001EFAC0B6|nr:FAD-dependent oxidoreductase [Croceicoccus hydrothermalis]
MTERFDIVIVGAGMAGASLAARLAPHRSVMMIEAEDEPGYHATGRSAAFWAESYGGPQITPLTIASGPYLRRHGFLAPRGALTLAREGDRGRIAAFVARFATLGVDVAMLNREEIEARVPGIREGWTAASWEPDCCDIDVAALHAHFLALARRDGAGLRSRARLSAARRERGDWHLELADGATIRAGVLVNAAGAWADGVAHMAGARPLNIAPLRRTVAQVRTDPPVPATLPLVLDIDERFYFKPENGRIWLSPHDETPSVPCDAAPEEIDVATAIARLEEVVDWRAEHVERRWAGLRSFAPDRLPVYGWDPVVEGFFWCAGQGGFVIQTAPAGSALAAALLLGQDVDEPLDPSSYDPARFA